MRNRMPKKQLSKCLSPALPRENGSLKTVSTIVYIKQGSQRSFEKKVQFILVSFSYLRAHISHTKKCLPSCSFHQLNPPTPGTHTTTSQTSIPLELLSAKEPTQSQVRILRIFLVFDLSLPYSLYLTTFQILYIRLSRYI